MADKKIQLHTQDGTDNLYPVTKAANVTGLATVATSGSYNDLSNKPSIPTIPTNYVKTDATSTITTTPTDGASPLYIRNNGTYQYTRALSIMAPNMGANQRLIFEIGKASNTKNRAQFEYVHSSDGSNNNRFSLGMYGVDDVLVINGNGRVGIKNTSPTCELDVTGSTKVSKWHADSHYAYNLCRLFTSSTPNQMVVKTKILYKSSAHMPVIRIYGYAYGLHSPIELKVGFYIFGGNLGWSGAVSMGAWRPEIYLFKYTEESVDYVALGLKGACYFPGFQVDAQVGASGAFGDNFKLDGWTTLNKAVSDTNPGDIIPAVGTDNCIKVPYKSTLETLSFSNGTKYDGTEAKTITYATVGAAAASHTHAQTDITGLSTSLAAKLDKSEADDTYAVIDHNHDSKYIGFTDKTVTVAGTSKVVSKTSKDTLFAKGGMIFGGTAAAAGLVTRGICGVATPADADGSCTKSHLFINYDGNNNFNSGRQLVLNAGAVGTHLGNNMYEYTVPRGDIVKAYCDAHYLASVPTASSTVLGGIKIASPFTISNGVLGINSFTGTSAGLVPAYSGDEDDSAVLKQTGWGHLTAGQVGAAAASHNHSAANITSGTLAVARGGTGKTTGVDAANYFLNELTEGTSTPKDADYFISQYANGGTSTKTYHRRPVSALWNLYKTKCTTGVFVDAATTYTGKPIRFVAGSGAGVSISNSTSYVTVTISTNSTCLIEGTKIKMFDGTEKNIEDIVEGDSIMSYDPNTNSNVEAIITSNVCTGIADDYTNYYFDDGNFVTIFGKHCLYNVGSGTARGVEHWQIGWRGMNDKNEINQFIGSEEIHHVGRKRHYDMRSSNKLYYANGILAAQSLTLDHSTLPERDPDLPQSFLDAIKADYDSSVNVTKHTINKEYGKRLIPILKEMKAQQKKMDTNKKRLADTDYIVSKFTEGLISAVEWAKSKNERSSWRKLVNEAEDALASVTKQYEQLKTEFAPQTTMKERFDAAVARDNACLNDLKEYYKEKNSK